MSALEAIVGRAVTWPEDAQEELARVACEIEAELEQGIYRAMQVSCAA